MIKRLYIEVTNGCNLRCEFCGISQRSVQIMDLDLFELVLQQSRGVCDFIYLHVKGEPLLHPDLLGLLDLAAQYGKRVQLVTNGTLLGNYDQQLFYHPALRKVSISLQGFFQWDQAVEGLDKLYHQVNELLGNPRLIVELRLWTGEHQAAMNFVQRFGNPVKFGRDIRIKDNLYVSFDQEFVWPSLDQSLHYSKSCLGPKMMLAVLSDGTITPCCLDQDGLLSLGNVKDITLSEALQSERYLAMVKGFQNNQAVERLCQSCRY